jgi:hypothetical protein
MIRRGRLANLETALQEHEAQVDSLLKDANKYLGALKTWKKACQTGHLANRQKAAAQATELAGGLREPTQGTAASWEFDTRAYLESDDWREEVQTTAAERFGLRVLEEGDTLISSPVVIRALPGRAALQIGKVNWPTLRPRIVAAELRRLRDRASSANSQEFVDSLFGASERLTQSGDPVVKFRDIYDLFSLTPGWKKDNPPAAFGQAVYALHRSEIRATRGGRSFEIVYPSGNVKERDVFTVIAEEGKALRYYGIRFR